MKVTKTEINNNTSVKHVKGFGAHAVRAYYVEISTPDGLIGFGAETLGRLDVHQDADGNVVNVIEACVTNKKDFVNEVHEYLNKA